MTSRHYAGQVECAGLRIPAKFSSGTSGFVFVLRRWLVERTLGWFGRWRCLLKNFEELPEVSEAMITLTATRNLA